MSSGIKKAKIEISESIIDQADKCLYAHKCLEDIDLVECKIVDCVDNKVFFVENCSFECPYQIPFGMAYTCMCPVRQELYLKYKE